MSERRSVMRGLAAIFVWPGLSLEARADRVGYAAIFDCKAESDLLIAEHHHDWSPATRDARWKMFSTDRNVFGPNNTYSTLSVTDRHSGERRFTAAVPALTFLWISGDSRFIVGVSRVKLWNPIQLVVFDAAGRLLLAKAISAASTDEATQTVSNWVDWYRLPAPRMSIEPMLGTGFTLSVEGHDGEPHRFMFSTPH